jgi:hypothetical protein
VSPGDPPVDGLPLMRGLLDTAGERLGIDCTLHWVDQLLHEGADRALVDGDPSTGTVQVHVEATRAPFQTRGWEPLTRGVWERDGVLVLANILSTGFDLRVDCTEGAACFTFRWRPGRRERLLARGLRSRFHLLARSALLRYPTMWWAGTRGRVPLHASVCTAGGAVVLLAGPGGVGKSTLVTKELAAGGKAICDNVCVADGASAWGVVEPLRLEGGSGRRMQHGRREATMIGRVPSLVPDRVVVLRRGVQETATIQACSSAAAARSLVTSTYMAAELRRYWSFMATLAAGTGAGPSHPPIAEVASAFTRKLPALLVILPKKPGPGLAELLDTVEAEKCG